MEQKRVSFKVAKAIKEAGYPQEYPMEIYLEDGSYFYTGGMLDTNNTVYYRIVSYLDVWLWLWREKNFSIDIDCYNCDKWTTDVNGIEFNDPEEAIIAAIEYMVDNNLIK